MTYSYEYDESGLTSSYLGLSFLIPVTLYYTYQRWNTRFQPITECNQCTKKNKYNMYPNLKWCIILSTLWILISILVYNIKTISVDTKKSYDPLLVLGIDADTSESDVKKRLITLLQKYNPRKASISLKEEYQKKLEEITRSYNIIKDKTKYTEWLNNNSKSGEIVAIPDIFIRNAYMALFIYILVIGFFLPKYAYKKWKNMKDKNFQGVEYETMDVFMNLIDDDLNKKVDTPCFMRNLMGILSKSKEMACYNFKSDVLSVKRLVEYSYGYPLPDVRNCNKGFLVLMNHLFRLNACSNSEVDYIRNTSLLLVEGMKVICISKGYTEILKRVFVLQSMITQAVFDEEYFLLQYPLIEWKDLFLLKMKNERINLDILNKVLESKNLALVQAFHAKIPEIQIDEFVAFVKKTGECSSTSDIEDDCSMVVPTSKIGSAFTIPRNSEVTIRIRLSTSTRNNKFVHTHFIQKGLKNTFTVFITIDNILYKKYVCFDDDSKEVLFEFKGSNYIKQSEIKVFVLCGHYLKRNVEDSLVIKYI